jgi:phospholipid-binding lipoprotein MlaA
MGATFLLLAAGCASTGSLAEDDPLEPVNRAMFTIHQPLETYVMRPIVDVYEVITPTVGQRIIANFFNNIDDLFSGVSGLLQGKLDSAGHDFGRVIVNTSFGLGGMIDFASDADIPRGNQDFGLLLAHWGAGPRPYLFIPVMGPTTLRDGAGMIGQTYASPMSWRMIDEHVALRNTLQGLGIANAMSSGIKTLDTLDRIALDRYTFIRSAYLQRRAYQADDDSYQRAAFEDFDEEE